MQISGKNTIGYRLSQLGSKTFRTFNPLKNKENESIFYEAVKEEVSEAMQLAAEAFQQYARVPGKDRAKFLEAIAAGLETHREQLVRQYTLESGLPEDRGNTELNRTIFHLGAFAALIKDDTWQRVAIDPADPGRKPLPKPDLRKMYFPLGPVVVFGASNFPFAYSTIGGDATAALAAGCPVIIKSHAMHAGTGDLVAQLITKAAKETGMPDGVFSNLNAIGYEVGESLVLHPATKAVGFTGSFKGGMSLYKLNEKRTEPIPVFAEMGSLNPVIVLPGIMKAETDKVASTLAASVTQSAGQFCTNPGLIFTIGNESLAAFKQKLAENIGATAPQCMLHPDIHKKYNELRKEVAAQASVTVLTEERKDVLPNHGVPQLSEVSGKVFLENKVLHGEVFGPHSLLVICDDETELMKIVADLEGQLAAAVFADETELQDIGELVFALQQKAGRIIFNGVPTGVEVSAAMHHGGPFPATTDARFTAVGTDAIYRFVRAIALQGFPQTLLPKFLNSGSI